jgi:cytidine deaminase
MVHPDLLPRAQLAAQQAYCPYSHFPVGACIESDGGALYSGCNIENASYSLGLCAESSAIAQMIINGSKKIRSIAIYTPTDTPTSPCGACRQRIFEFSLDSTLVYLCTPDNEPMITTIQELLPHAFGPKNLEKP